MRWYFVLGSNEISIEDSVDYFAVTCFSHIDSRQSQQVEVGYPGCLTAQVGVLY